MQTAQQNHVYFYGLPPNNVTSNQIRLRIKEITGIELKADNPPQIRRDINKPTWTAVLKFENPEEREKIMKEMRYFKWFSDDNAKPIEIRALGYDPEVRRREEDEIKEKNVFIRHIPSDMTHSQLFAVLTKSISESDLKSVMVSIDPESQKSRKYGFASTVSVDVAR